MSRQTERQAQLLSAGTCIVCGKRPKSRRSKSRCDACLANMRLYMRERKQAREAGARETGAPVHGTDQGGGE